MSVICGFGSVVQLLQETVDMAEKIKCQNSVASLKPADFDSVEALCAPNEGLNSARFYSRSTTGIMPQIFTLVSNL